MKIKRVSPWGGGKATLAAKYIVPLLEIEPTDEYAEGCVGGCAIVPVMPRCKSEWLNDLNPKIVNVLTQLRDHPDRIINRLASVPFSRDEYEAAQIILDPTFGLPPDIPDWIAASQLIVWWMGPNGLAGTDTKGWFATRHTATGGHPAVRWESFKESMPMLSERLQGSRITRLDFEAMLTEVPDEKRRKMYFDPPYFTKAFKYECDFKPDDHRRLATILNEYKRARIVVSYYDDVSTDSLCDGSLLDELYPPEKWRRLQVEMSKASASASGKSKRATEVLLINDARIAA